MKVRGCDASWLNDIEPPPSHIDYSDDEEERRAARARKTKNKEDENTQNDGETSRNVRKPVERRNQRPSEWNSRFGSGPSRGRNPFALGSRRHGRPPPLSADGSAFIPPFNPNTPPPYNPAAPPPFSSLFQFGSSPRLHSPFRTNAPVFMSTPGPHWLTRPPPPPGT